VANVTEEVEIDPQQCFEDIFKQEKYRKRLSQMAIANNASLVVDFDDLIVFDLALAENLREKPDEFLQHANRAAHAQLEIEDSEYASRTAEITVRFRNPPVPTPLRMLGAANIGKLVLVRGIIVRATPVQPQVMRAAFKCKRCGESAYLDQTGPFLKAPLKSWETRKYLYRFLH